MNILITGAFGSVGQSILQCLDDKEYRISCFDILNKRTSKIAKKYKNCEIFWGDVRDKKSLRNAVNNQDIVIHLAFMLPPIPEEKLGIARSINIEGTKNLIAAMENSSQNPKLIFASSVSIYGDVRDQSQPIPINKEPNPADNYAKQKVEAAEIVINSKLDYSIFVLGFIPPIKNVNFDSMMYEIPLDSKIELLHISDVGLAFANAINNQDIWNKVLHIGGGPTARTSYEAFVQGSLETMGIGALPIQAFGGELYHTCYMSSEDSNQLLNYQQHSFQDILEDMKKNHRMKSFLAKIFQKPIRNILVKKSPYYKKRN